MKTQITKFSPPYLESMMYLRCLCKVASEWGMTQQRTKLNEPMSTRSTSSTRNRRNCKNDSMIRTHDALRRRPSMLHLGAHTKLSYIDNSLAPWGSPPCEQQSPKHTTSQPETMFIIRKTFNFEASHQLEHHDGKCARVHGHSYKMEVELASHTLQSSGAKKNMVTDFDDISAVVKKLVHEHLDHRHLNESLDTDSPTAEFIAQWVYYRLKNALPLLRSITIRETHSSSVTYSPNMECMCNGTGNGTRANGKA